MMSKEFLGGKAKTIAPGSLHPVEKSKINTIVFIFQRVIKLGIEKIIRLVLKIYDKINFKPIIIRSVEFELSCAF